MSLIKEAITNGGRFVGNLLIKTSTRYYEFDYTGYVDGKEIRLKKLDRGKYEDMEGNVYYINT